VLQTMYGKTVRVVLVRPDADLWFASLSLQPSVTVFVRQPEAYCNDRWCMPECAADAANSLALSNSQTVLEASIIIISAPASVLK